MFALSTKKRIRPEESPQKIRSFCELLLHNVRSVQLEVSFFVFRYVYYILGKIYSISKMKMIVIDCNSGSHTRRNKNIKMACI